MSEISEKEYAEFVERFGKLAPPSLDQLRASCGLEEGDFFESLDKYGIHFESLTDRFARLINEFGDGLDVTVIFEKDGKQIASRRI